jgi:hypothetical protein
MKRSAAILAMALTSSSAIFGGSPADELKKLDVWAGHWTTRGESKDTPYSRAESLSSEMTCAWAPHHGYLICDQTIAGKDGRINSLSVYTYSETEKKFKFYGIGQGGNPRTPPLTVNGNVWTYGGGTEAGSRTTARKSRSGRPTSSYRPRRCSGARSFPTTAAGIGA